MQVLNAVDYLVILVYFSCLVGLGFYRQRKAAASLEDYFLAGRKMPWWLLGVSGMATFLDVTGTMIVVSLLFLLGPRGLFLEFRGGAVLVLAVYMMWAGKWHRRSGCMTGAEWMVYRFGKGAGGQFARFARALAEILWSVGMIAYLVKGVGLFFSMFVPLPPIYCSLILLVIATVYTMVSGFYGVVFTDLFQAGLIMIAVVAISVMAFNAAPDADALAQVAQQVTHTDQWMTGYPQWRTQIPLGGEYEAFQWLALFAAFYLIKNVLLGAGSGDDPRFFGARSDAECGKLSALWTFLMMFRWPMMMGFAVLGLFLIKDTFPDQNVMAQAAALVKDHFPGLDKARWADTIANVRLHVEAYPDLVASLQHTLGDDWRQSINLVGFEGKYDPERILPAVIIYRIPIGFRGFLLVALTAAVMSTFDSTVNKTAGFFTRDLYQQYLRPAAKNRELILASWIFVIALVAVGFGVGYFAKSINNIWGWITMGLGGGLLAPLVIRFYWWRFNGGGFAIGMIAGIIAAIVQMKFFPEWHDLIKFAAVGGVGLVATIVGTFLTRPTDQAVLENFYRTTRPFGFWGPLLHTLSPEQLKATRREHLNDIIGLPFALLWQITLFLLPMFLVVHNFKAFWITLPLFLIGIAGLYHFWYKNLTPEQPDEQLTNAQKTS